ncbi:MAG: hypothetical protein GWP02_02445, partial [Desulfobulbaceae bacterium]|nr:hypothetical protein [Desulfobulbaceae bacterium]
VKVGTLGIGLEGRWDALPFLDLRLGANSYELDADDSYSGIDYEGTLDLETYYLTANFNFPLSPFRITAGIFSNGNELNMTSAVAGDFTIGGDFYTGAEVGTLTTNTSFKNTAPYLGIGVDFELFDKAGLNFDLGVLWQDEPLVTLDASGALANDPFFRASLAAEQQDLTDDLGDFKAYPVISLALIYNF